MYNRILFPTDGSETAQNAFSHAVELAEGYGSALEVVIVVDEHDLFLEGAGDEYEEGAEDRRKAREEVDGMLGILVDEARERGIEAKSTVLEHESPVVALLDHIEDEEVDAIVMGTHGRSGVRRFVMGSVAERVVRNAHVPTLLVPAKARP